MSVYTPDDALAHYGILGMKWGVRKDRSKGSGKKKSSAKAKAKKPAWNKEAVDLEEQNKKRAERQLKLVPEASKKARAHIDKNPDTFGKVSDSRFDKAVARTKTVISDLTDDEELWDSSDSIADEICSQVQWLKQYGDSAKHSALAHHGVLGMKWGVRHDRKSSGNRTAGAKAKKPSSNERQQAAAEAQRQKNLKKVVDQMMDEVVRETKRESGYDLTKHPDVYKQVRGELQRQYVSKLQERAHRQATQQHRQAMEMGRQAFQQQQQNFQQQQYRSMGFPY